MTFDNEPHPQGPPAQGQPPQGPPPQGQPGQIPPPPPQKRRSGNVLNGWLYVSLGVAFVLIGLIGFADSNRNAIFNWIFIALGLLNGGLGIRSVIAARKPPIDPFATGGTDAR